MIKVQTISRLPKHPVTGTRVPVNLQSFTHSDLKLLSVYLWLKSKAVDGAVSRSVIRDVWYWKDRLIRHGLIKLDRSGRYYLVRGYHGAWEMFNLQKTSSRNKAFKRVWCRRINAPDTHRKILENLFAQKASTLERQLRYARRSGGRNNRHVQFEVPLSASTVQRLYGYKSPFTGSLKRRKFFRVVSDPLKRIHVYNPDVDPYHLIVRYETKKVLC